MEYKKKNYNTEGVDLKEHLELYIQLIQKYFEIQLSAIEKASEEEKMTLKRRLDSMNDLIGYPSRIDGELEFIRKDISDFKTFKDTQQGKASQSTVTVTMIISLTGLALTILNFFMK